MTHFFEMTVWEWVVFVAVVVLLGWVLRSRP